MKLLQNEFNLLLGLHQIIIKIYEFPLLNYKQKNGTVIIEEHFLTNFEWFYLS